MKDHKFNSFILLLIFGILAIAFYWGEEDKEYLKENGVNVVANVTNVSSKVEIKHHSDGESYSSQNYYITINYEHPKKGFIVDTKSLGQSIYLKHKNATPKNPVELDIVVDPEDPKRWKTKDSVESSNIPFIIFFILCTISFVYYMLARTLLVKSKSDSQSSS